MCLLRLILLSSFWFYFKVVTAEPIDEGNRKVMIPTIREVKSKYQQEWLQNPDVVSVGIGMTPDKKPAIIVGVKSNVSAKQLHLPSEIEGYPLMVEIIGSPQAE